VYNKTIEREMIKMKINLKDWTYIGVYNPAVKWVRRFCDYKLMLEKNGNFKREVKIGIIPYIIMFMPVHLIVFVNCLWDGGLKEFEIQKRHLGYDILRKDTASWERAKNIYERRLWK
jgi:hypothetical protein